MLTLDLPTLYSLLYGFEDYDFTRPESLDPREQALVHRIRIVPLNLGQILAELDKDGQFFHIEFYPQKHKAEIWSARSWNESVTKYLKQRAEFRASDPASILADRLPALERELAAHLQMRFRTTREAAVSCAKGMIHYGLDPDFAKLLVLEQRFMRALEEVQKLMKASQENDNLGPSNTSNQ